ncbi:MAG: CpsD/CapB family tyrosine-protein kinase [Balneolaceae bacterium]
MGKQNISEKKEKKSINENQSIEIIGNGHIARSSELLPVHVSTESLTTIDHKTVALKYYNSFNFSKLASTFKDKMTIGITSANRNDGKTLVAANMAVSLAGGYKQKTLIIDMNFRHPKLHKVFGTDLYPGMAEVLEYKKVRVVPTSVNNLYLMTAGDSKLTPGIEQTLLLRQILYSLRNEFDFVIIDMGSIYPIEDFPIYFINEIDGLIGVIDSRKTKKEDFKRIFKHLDESQFIAYVFNRVNKS